MVLPQAEWKRLLAGIERTWVGWRMGAEKKNPMLPRWRLLDLDDQNSTDAIDGAAALSGGQVWGCEPLRISITIV